MRKTAVLTGTFDPLTASELACAARLRRQGYGLIIFAAAEEGVLPKEKREELIWQAIRPFDRYAIGSAEGFTEVFHPDGEEDEAAIRKGDFYLAAPGIRGTLVREGLYAEQILSTWCKPARAAHARGVAKLAKELAECHGLDGQQAWLAGMLHDVTKNRDDAFNRHILEIYDPDKLTYDAKVWHSFTAPVWLKQHLGLSDPDILEAIYCHTLGDGRTRLDQILYIADKCDETRPWPTEKEIALSRKDLQAGFRLVKQEEEEDLRKRGVK